MLNQTLADELLVVVALSLLVAELYALRMVRVLQRRLDGGSGDYLLRVVFRFGAFVTIGQAFTVANAILRVTTYETTADARLIVFLLIETLLAFAFIWTVWEIHHLPVDSHGQHASIQPPEPCECLCKQINDAVSPAGAPVD